MTIEADALLSGPRGRRLCLEYALACAYDGSAPGQHAATAVFWAADAYEGGTVALARSDGVGEPFEPPTVRVAEAAAALGALAPVEPDSVRLREALARSADAAMYWQPADGRDVLAGREEFTSPLRRVAELIAAAPAAAWWGSAVDRDDQWTVPWDGGGRLLDVDAVLAAWRAHTLADEVSASRDRPADATANWSGSWWSIPPASLVRTTRSLGADGPAGLWFVEDSPGGDEAVATPVDAYPAHVIEIDGPDDWAELCRRHPLDVTASRRHDWYRVTGRDGRWIIPDWPAVAAEADAVHLTVRGYLTAATRLIDVDGDAASVPAGWNPDETYWFRGVSARPSDAQRWLREDDAWRPAS